jgi:hypothetical protein
MALMILRECRFSPKEKNDNPQIDSLHMYTSKNG